MAADESAQLVPWRRHPEVWILVLTLVAGYWWALRRLGPYCAPKDKPIVTGWQITAFLAAVASLWAVSAWPLHDIAEEALVSAHMIEHLTLALIFPSLILLGIPSWLWQALFEPVIPVLRRITHPMVGLFVFNSVFAATHWPPMLAIQNQSEWWHFTGHHILVAAGFLMFWPVLSPCPRSPD